MSATIQTALFKQYFNLSDDFIVSAPGQESPFPIEIKCKPLLADNNLVTSIVSSVVEIANDHPIGDILVFMPGRKEVDKACSIAQDQIKDSYIIGLYGGITQQESEEELRKSESRKIIFATNVAETSITFPDLKIVVDPGKERTIVYESGNSCLTTTNITQASAKQRKGRVGRNSPGICYRLYSEQEYSSLQDYRAPEILRAPLHQTILSLKVKNLYDIEFVNPPSNDETKTAIRLLQYLKALDKDENPTELGHQLLKLPVSLEMGKALLASVEFNCSEEMCKIAAMTTVGYFIFKKDEKVCISP